MRLRKELDELQEKEVLIIAQVSDALAHPARIKIFRYSSEECPKFPPPRISFSSSVTRRPQSPST